MEAMTNEQLCALAQAGDEQAQSQLIENNLPFLSYAAPAVRRTMRDLILQYSQDAIWRLKKDKANTWKIVYLDEFLGDFGEDTMESLIALPRVKLPEQICIARETAAELHETMDALPERESIYVQYRFGLTNGEAHPLTGSCAIFLVDGELCEGR